MNEEEFLEYKETLTRLLSEYHVETLRGEQISYARFLTDVMVLIHFIQYRIGSKIKGFLSLYQVFSPYFTTTEWFEKQRNKIIEIMSLNDLRLYDFYRGTVRISFERMAVEKFGGTNEVFIHRLAHNTSLQKVDGKKRTILQLGVPSSEKVDKFNWVAIRPSQLGITDRDDDSPMPVFIQQHVLERFEERIVFWRGYVQVYLGYVLSKAKVNTILRNGYFLLECFLGVHKVGYFVITHHMDKWLVRTFLFLTNDGTPEGNKLKKITHLEIPDKQFLMLDRMDAFITYGISEDKKLRELFEKVGCSSLLDYADELRKFVGDPLKSPEFIHRYLFRI
ncbi:hypothetical protein [Sphingobacterium sp. WOUb80]|uniref:hypothetical protein n=1 Tax=Sphingobacterium sp. WOUb80 TaxID=3234028 RepID=UPI003CEAAB9F